jgi:amino acid transporter
VFRSYIDRLSQSRFWLSKWVVAAALAACAVIVGLFLLFTSNVSFETFLNYFALGLLVFVLITLFYGIIAIHDVPYEIARHRDHPHQDAIHAAGWVSLFTLHVIWPFLWIWAMLYRPDRGWGFTDTAADASRPDARLDAIEELRRRVAELERRSDAGTR